MEEQIAELSLSSLERHIDTIDTIITDLKYTSVVFENTARETGFFNNNSNQSHFIYKTLRPFVFSNKNITSINLYSESSGSILTLDGQFNIGMYPDKDWIKFSRNRKLSEPFLMLRETKVRQNPFLSIIKPIQNNKTGEYYGAIIIDTKINESLSKYKKQFSQLSIMNSNHKVIYSDNISEVGKNMRNLDDSGNYLKLKNSSNIYEYDKKNHYILIKRTSESHNLKYFYKVPLSIFEDKYNDLYRLLTIALIILSVIIVCASVIISLNNYKPIDNLLTIIEDPVSANLSLTRTKEIKEIATNILSSINNNRHLKDEMLDQLYQLDKTRILALQSQINPHFLYNTLDAIRWKSMSLTNGENEVSTMIGILAKLLRISLEGDDNITTLKEELEHVSLFVKILNSRYEDKFNFEIELEDGLDNYQLLKLCLQPLLENACYHGIKPTRKQGTVKIIGKTDKNNLIITVEDTGAGIKDLEALRRQINKKMNFTDSHIGLRNVHQRIKLIFGEEYGISIRSKENRGTSINLTFPLIQDTTKEFQ